MRTYGVLKINCLLASQPKGVVLTSACLSERGYSLDLQRRYRTSHWFESIGTGAMVRTGDSVDWLGGVYALQTQLGLAAHPAATTALALQGRAHYLALSTQRVQLFSASGVHLPRWFRRHDWGVFVDCVGTNFLPPDLGMTAMNHKAFSVRVASPARAIMECLYLAPAKQPLEEAAELMSGLNNLRPNLVQELLENCKSVKVKRLFLYLAERAGHAWLGWVDQSRVDLGAGKRSLASPGVYVPAYRITVPEALERPDA